MAGDAARRAGGPACHRCLRVAGIETADAARRGLLDLPARRPREPRRAYRGAPALRAAAERRALFAARAADSPVGQAVASGGRAARESDAHAGRPGLHRLRPRGRGLARRSQGERRCRVVAGACSAETIKNAQTLTAPAIAEKSGTWSCRAP